MMREDGDDLQVLFMQGLRTFFTLGWAGLVALAAAYGIESGGDEPASGFVWLFVGAMFVAMFYAWYVGRAEGLFWPRTAALVVNILPLAYLLLSAPTLIELLS
jgi:hypothetical protein